MVVQLMLDIMQDIIKSSYDKNKKKQIGDYLLDSSISNNESRVYQNPVNNHAIISHRGTSGYSDWLNNAIFQFQGTKAYKDTNRYKKAETVQKAAENKYNNITTIGHSQGAVIAENLGKNGEVITLNKMTRPFSNIIKNKNQYDIRSSNDIPSMGYQKLNGNEININAKSSINPFIEHSSNILSRLGRDNEIGNI